MFEPRPLRATYRLQMNSSFTFADAIAVVPLLQRLGISHLYLSPILEAAKGSTHGYDVVDHSRVSTALGGEAGFDALVNAAHRAGLGLIVDIVPNHMSIADSSNRWWWDVLENGPASRWAHAFDIDWDSPEPRLKNTVLLPVLGDHRYRLIEKREIAVVREGAQLNIRYQNRSFPVAPRATGSLLQRAAASHDVSKHLAFIADSLAELPGPDGLNADGIRRQHRDKAVLREWLAALLKADPRIGEAIDDALATVNAAPKQLDSLLEQQSYRLAYWRTAEHDLDYRRFFDVNSLLALRIEDPEVFAEVHAVVAGWVQKGKVDGVRVDHVDGLANPSGYLMTLKKLLPNATVHVEKILGADEVLEPWPVEGTTGYEFAADLTSLFLPPEVEAPITAVCEQLCGPPVPADVLALQGRQQVLKESLHSDVSRVANVLSRLSDRHPQLRDYSRHHFREALATLAAVFPVYRTYVSPDEPSGPHRSDLAVLSQAVASAKTLAPNIDPVLLDFVHQLMRLEVTGELEAEFVRRFQQLTGPATAKGVEDTAFYRDYRLLALDEVGSNPSRFSLSLEAFHRRNQQALQSWPDRLLGTSTHDTKRSEDVRARLVAMAQAPTDYATLAHSFFAHARRYLGGNVPEPGLMMVTFQTLVGAWPLSEARLAEFLVKAAREAKLATNWVNPNAEYEAALKAFCGAVLKDEEIGRELEGYVSGLVPSARAISLGWTLLKCTAPGVPDFYQGSERWIFSLVDPDNRRPVDWARLEQALAVSVPPPLDADDTGLRKLEVIRSALRLRREQPASFGRGSKYVPLTLSGPGAEAVIAFARTSPDGLHSAVVAVTRLPGKDLANTALLLPKGTFRSRLGDARDFSAKVALPELFATSPVALLASH